VGLSGRIMYIKRNTRFAKKKTPFRVFCVLGVFLFSACTPQPAQSAPPSPEPSAVATSSSVHPTAIPSQPPTPAADPSCTQQTGQEASIQVEAPGLVNPLKARIHLPPCYNPAVSTRYPVLYLLHGQGFTSDQWERLGAPQILDRLAAAGEIQPLLLVLPEETDTTINPFESAFGPALIDALIPAIDKAYPTCARRECRAIGGLSRGASWAVYLAFSHPDRFAAAGAHSFPPFNGLDQRLPRLIADLPPGQPLAIYIDIGVKDPYRSPASAFESLLNQADVPHEWYLNQGSHDEAYWSAHVEEYLRWYAAQLTTVKP
jgi:enterochelin esterase-like enzyme